MKNLFKVLLAMFMAFAMTACGSSSGSSNAADTEKGEGVMTYAEYDAAKVDDEVTIEAYVQAKQSWWNNSATIYTQDADGAYFIYGMACSEEEYDKLAQGTKIKV